MQTDKDYALQLIDHLEHATVAISVLQHLLKHSGMKNWEEEYRRMLADPRPRNTVHEQFSQWRDAILAAPDWTLAVREILKDLPPLDPTD
jgi:hypothetical protein